MNEDELNLDELPDELKEMSVMGMLNFIDFEIPRRYQQCRDNFITTGNPEFLADMLEYVMM